MNHAVNTKNNSTLNLDTYVPALVTLLANKLSSGASVCYRSQFGVGVTEWRLLALLAVEPDISANRVCQVVGLDKAAVSRAVKQAVNNKWVTLEKDQGDARQSLLRLTTQGRRLHDDILNVALQREALLLEGLSDTEQQQLVHLLHHLIARLPAVNSL